jgi:hypothetical protein
VSDIFLSYARKDKPYASGLATALNRLGWSVWWDTDIPAAKTYPEVLESQVKSARCVLVLWSSTSIKSDWVKLEASTGRTRGVLVSVLTEEDIEPPWEFMRIQAMSLAGWDGSVADERFVKLIVWLSGLLGPPPEPIDRASTPQTTLAHRRKPGLGMLMAIVGIVTAVVVSFGLWQRGDPSSTAPGTTAPSSNPRPTLSPSASAVQSNTPTQRSAPGRSASAATNLSDRPTTAAPMQAPTEPTPARPVPTTHRVRLVLDRIEVLEDGVELGRGSRWEFDIDVQNGPTLPIEWYYYNDKTREKVRTFARSACVEMDLPGDGSTADDKVTLSIEGRRDAPTWRVGGTGQVAIETTPPPSPIPVASGIAVVHTANPKDASFRFHLKLVQPNSYVRCKEKG